MQQPIMPMQQTGMPMQQMGVPMQQTGIISGMSMNHNGMGQMPSQMANMSLQSQPMGLQRQATGAPIGAQSSPYIQQQMTGGATSSHIQSQFMNGSSSNGFQPPLPPLPSQFQNQSGLSNFRNQMTTQSNATNINKAFDPYNSNTQPLFNNSSVDGGPSPGDINSMLLQKRIAQNNAPGGRLPPSPPFSNASSPYSSYGAPGRLSDSDDAQDSPPNMGGHSNGYTQRISPQRDMESRNMISNTASRFTSEEQSFASRFPINPGGGY